MFYPALSVVLSGLSFGIFFTMVDAYKGGVPLTSHLLPKMAGAGLGGMLLYLVVWAGYSLFINRLLKKDVKEVLKTDGYSYLPSLLLLLYAFQFYGPFDGMVNYFAQTYEEFSGAFLLAPAKMLAFVVLNLTVFLKIMAEDFWSDKIESFFSSERRVKTILGAAVGVYFLVFSALSILQYMSFNTTFDLATYNQAFWNTLHGRFFYTSLQEHVHPGVKIASTFSLHFSPIYLVLLPFYAIYSHVNTLLVLQSLFLALGAVPVYLIGRDRLGNFGGLVFALAYLLFPSVAYINLFDFHEVSMAPLLLLFSFYYFEKGEYRRFLLFMMLSLAIKEIIAMATFMFGVYAAVTRRGKKWILAPIIISTVWFFGALYAVTPLFGEGYTELLGGLYPALGGSLPEIAKTVIFHPIYTVKLLMEPAKIIYLILMLFPVGFLSLLNPAALLITVPMFLRNLLAFHRFFYEINFHYTADIIPFIMVSAIFGTAALISRVENRRFKYALLVFIFLNASASHVLYGPSPAGAFFNADKYSLDERTSAGEVIVEMVPENSAVASQMFYITHLSQREEAYILWNDSELFETHAEIEYSVIDTVRTFDEIFPPWAHIFDSPEWGIVYELEGHVLAKRGAEDSLALYEVSDEKPVAQAPGSWEGNGIKFLGYDVLEEGEKKGHRILRITYYWECVERPASNYTVHMYLLDRDSKALLHREHKPAYGLYPTSEWKSGEIVKETHGILIPENLERDSYYVKASMG